MKSPKTKPEGIQRSLFGEILDWLLAPLLFVWPVSIAVTHYFANSVAAYPYDQNLRENVSAIARQVKFDKGKVIVLFPGSARALLRSDEVDQVYFHVVHRSGKHIAGDIELPVAADVATQPDEPGETYFRDAEYNGHDFRIAYQYVADAGIPRDQWVLVEVGETREKRSQLANRIVASVILPQFVIIPLAVVLVWFGLSQGLRPLTQLRTKIEARPPGDLSEIPTRGVPDELAPLVAAFNALIERTRVNMKAQQRFIADAAHQLRTPLAGLKMQAQLASRQTEPEALRLALDHVVEGVDRANRLVNQMLALARAEALDREQALQPVEVEALLVGLAGDWFDRAAARDIDFGFENEVLISADSTVMGQEFLLREMFSNLIDNALRYTPVEGSVTVRLLPMGDFLIVEVVDSGIGISESDAELVFEPFYRVDDSHSEGSGLGLAIVREIAELHRADVSLRPNSAGKGTVARVVLPVYRTGVEIEVLATAAPARLARNDDSEPDRTDLYNL